MSSSQARSICIRASGLDSPASISFFIILVSLLTTNLRQPVPSWNRDKCDCSASPSANVSAASSVIERAARIDSVPTGKEGSTEGPRCALSNRRQMGRTCASNRAAIPRNSSTVAVHCSAEVCMRAIIVCTSGRCARQRSKEDSTSSSTTSLGTSWLYPARLRYMSRFRTSSIGRDCRASSALVPSSVPMSREPCPPIDWINFAQYM